MEAPQTADNETAWLWVVAVVLLLVGILNLIVTIVFDLRNLGSQTVPLWIILLSLCLATKGMPFTAIFGGTILAAVSDLICLFKVDQTTKLQMIPPMVISVFILLLILDLLAAGKSEDIGNLRDNEYRAYRKNDKELLELKAKLEAKKNEKKENPGVREEDQALASRRLLLEMLKGVYTQVLGLRFKREVPKLLENLFSSWYKVECGLVFEQDSDSKDMRLRNHWGLTQRRTDAMSTVAALKDNLVFRWAFEHKEALNPEEAKRDFNLHQALDKFGSELFELTCTIPITVQDRNLFVVFLGKPLADAPIPLDLKQLQPLLQSLSMSLVKIGTKDSRPRLSTFAPGS